MVESDDGGGGGDDDGNNNRCFETKLLSSLQLGRLLAEISGATGGKLGGAVGMRLLWAALAEAVDLTSFGEVGGSERQTTNPCIWLALLGYTLLA